MIIFHLRGFHHVFNISLLFSSILNRNYLYYFCYCINVRYCKSTIICMVKHKWYSIRSRYLFNKSYIFFVTVLYIGLAYNIYNVVDKMHPCQTESPTRKYLEDDHYILRHFFYLAGILVLL